MRWRTAQILSIENVMARETGGRMSRRVIKQMKVEAADQLGFLPDVSLAVKANLAVSEALETQIALLEKRLRERVKLDPAYRLLQSTPGIGDILAMTIMLETGDN